MRIHFGWYVGFVLLFFSAPSLATQRPAITVESVQPSLTTTCVSLSLYVCVCVCVWVDMNKAKRITEPDLSQETRTYP